MVVVVVTPRYPCYAMLCYVILPPPKFTNLYGLSTISCFTFPTKFQFDKDAYGGACDTNLDDAIIDTACLLILLNRQQEKCGWETNHHVRSLSHGNSMRVRSNSMVVIVLSCNTKAPTPCYIYITPAKSLVGLNLNIQEPSGPTHTQIASNQPPSLEGTWTERVITMQTPME